MMPTPHNSRVADISSRVGKSRKLAFKLSLNRSCDQVLYYCSSKIYNVSHFHGVYLIRLNCGLPTINQPDTSLTFKHPKNQIQS